MLSDEMKTVEKDLCPGGIILHPDFTADFIYCFPGAYVYCDKEKCPSDCNEAHVSYSGGLLQRVWRSLYGKLLNV